MRSSHWIIIGALLIAEIAAIFETTMIYVALPTLIREFGDPITAGWLVTAHGLIGTSVALMAGRLGDIYGRKRVLLVMLSIAVAGSVLSAMTSDYMLVLLGRALQGCATALIPLSIGIIREVAAQGACSRRHRADDHRAGNGHRDRAWCWADGSSTISPGTRCSWSAR